MRDIGIDWDDLKRYVKEQIYTLPGIKNHKDKLTVLLTGSRAIGTYSKGSDVDIDVICTKEVYNKIQSEMVERGLTTNKKVAFYYLPKIGWDKYFGKEVGQPHISITNIDIIKEQIKSFEDVPVWIWSNAVIINDPRAQFKRIISLFKEYPMEVLKRKVKYRYLLSLYWLIDVYPHNHSKTDEVFSGTLAIVNGINELYKFFYLIEGKSYPYMEKLPLYVETTKLGKRFKPLLTKALNLVTGYKFERINVWDRLDKAIEILLYGDKSKEAYELSEACDKAMIDLGIEKYWVEAGYDNIDELLHGKLGPTP